MRRAGNIAKNTADLREPLLALTATALCLFWYVCQHKFPFLRELTEELYSLSWLILIYVTGWFFYLVLLTFRTRDLVLIALVVTAIIEFFSGYPFCPESEILLLLFAVTLGKAAHYFLSNHGDKMTERRILVEEEKNSKVIFFVIGLTIILVFSSWWHLDISNNFYHGLRWTGIWDNPDTFGTLMSVGSLLAVGLPFEKELGGWKISKLSSTIFLIALAMMTVGLLLSYSRGAWLGTAVGLLYLARAYGKFKWLYFVPAIFIVLLVVLLFWRNTSDSAPWYLKRLDFARPSVQHRVAAWSASLKMMRDYPFGVGTNQPVDIYQKSYLPPNGGAAAIMTNDFLILGTQLGVPALLCFVAYVCFSFRARTMDPTQIACRAGALTMLVAFWFDGGLFKLPTAAVFWILLELGTARPLPSNFSQSSSQKETAVSNT